MSRFLVDGNLPYYFSFWDDDGYIHQADIDDILNIVFKLVENEFRISDDLLSNLVERFGNH